MSRERYLREASEQATANRQQAMERLYNRYSGRKERERQEALEMDAFMKLQEERERAALERQQMEGSKGWMGMAGMGAGVGAMFGGPVGAAIGGLAGAGLGIFSEAGQKRGIADEHGKKMGWGRALGQTVGRAPTSGELMGLGMGAAQVATGLRQQQMLGASDASRAGGMSNEMMAADALANSSGAAAANLRRNPSLGSPGLMPSQDINSFSNRVQQMNRRPIPGTYIPLPAVGYTYGVG